MRYRSFAVGLFAALTLLPWSQGAPAPARRPDVYALLYIGMGSNDRVGNEKRTAEIIKNIRSAIRHEGAIVYQPGQPPAPVQPEPWADKLRVESLDGTAVLRIWLPEGTAQERAEAANEAVRLYMERYVDILREKYQSRRRKLEQKAQWAAVKKDAELGLEFQKQLHECQEAGDRLPRLLERARP